MILLGTHESTPDPHPSSGLSEVDRGDTYLSLIFCASSMTTFLPGLHILHPMGQTPTGFHGRLGIYLSAALTGGSDNYATSGFSPRTGHFHQNNCPANAVPEDCAGQALLMDPERNQTSGHDLEECCSRGEGHWSQAGK